MANIIQACMLKPCNPSLMNRDFANQAKTIVIGGTQRTRLSSQSQKAVIRNYAGNPEIRSAHIEDLIEGILVRMVAAGEISEEQMERIGATICSDEILNADWKKRSSLNAKKTKEDKGRTVVVTSDAELREIVNSVVEKELELQLKEEKLEAIAKEQGKKSEDYKKLEKELAPWIKDYEGQMKKVAEEAISRVELSFDKAMFGVMSTSGVIETVYGATSFAHAYSIDAASVEMDDWTANFTCRANVPEDDIFFGGALAEFTSAQHSKTGAEALDTSELYSNTMTHYMCVDINDLIGNLRSRGQFDTQGAVEIAKSRMPKYFEGFALVEPEAKQRSSASNVTPAILYIESIKDGMNLQPDFSKVIEFDKQTGKTVAAQGIELIERFAKDQTFRCGEINRFVMLGAEYKAYEEVFEKAGVTVLKSLKDLREVLKTEIERLA